MRCLALVLVSMVTTISALAGDVLIVADEFPAMEVVVSRLKAEENVAAKVINQIEMPPSLKEFDAVVVYIHGALSEKAEDAFIDYAQSGGKLVLLHHSISSGKRKNAHWFPFLGVSLPEGDLESGGYKWIEGVRFSLVNIAPNHFIMTNRMSWPEQIDYSDPKGTERKLPGFTLDKTEVYLNHVHAGRHELLMGLKYTHGPNGKTYYQSTAGWTKAAGKGLVIYLMPGHTKHDFETATYGRIVLNAIIFKQPTIAPN